MKKDNNSFKASNIKISKLNKGIALTLAGVATIGLGAFVTSQTKEAKAMIGRIVSSAARVTPRVTPKPQVQVPNYLSTSRLIGGSKGSINSGGTGGNGTQYNGVPKTNYKDYTSRRTDIIPATPSAPLTSPSSSTPTSPTTLSRQGNQFQGIPKTNYTQTRTDIRLPKQTTFSRLLSKS